jgi:D-arabinose 1-dehydrogenase-like Zn-dependent alcohol dehydrogenase
MHAAVYRGQSAVQVEEVPTPRIGAGEILICVEACGICHTDLKKIEHNLLEPPRIYGHETAGTVAAVGCGVTRFQPGDRVWPSTISRAWNVSTVDATTMHSAPFIRKWASQRASNRPGAGSRSTCA